MSRLSGSAAIAVAIVSLSPCAAAADIAVRTGEHPGFTRLVVEDPAIAGWQLGRTPEGYALRVSPGDRSFDISGAFRLITRKRLSSLRATPGGDLELGLGCSCHVEPAEIRAGVIVLDIHDGPAPPTSIHERSLPPEGMPESARVRPRSRPNAAVPGYDWRKIDQAQPAMTSQLGMNRPALDRMRQSLVEQLSRGAAAGAVDFVSDSRPAASPASAQAPMPHIQVLPEPGFEPAAGDRPASHLAAAGTECIADDRLDVGAWSSEKPVAEQMATALAGLTGEFDDPRPEALATAVRFYLSLGFGAEARQLLSRFDSAHPDREIWDAMALVLDGARQPGGVLAGFGTCDTSAALWSALADPPAGSRFVNGPAVLRSFSALPVHLRRHLGPRLAEDFMTRGDAVSARAVRDAMVRAPGNAGRAAALTDARLAMAEGMSTPIDSLAAISGEPGSTGATALALLVEQQVAAGETPSAENVVALASMLREHRGSEAGLRLSRAYRLALAATGDFDLAFAQRDLAPEADAEVWRLLAESGADSEVLARAVLADGQDVPAIPVATRRDLARRLIELGLAAPARRWMHSVPAEDPEDRLILARIALEERNAPRALGVLAGLSGEEADRLRAAARLDLPETADRPVEAPASRIPSGVAVADAPVLTSVSGPRGNSPPAAAAEGSAELAGPLARSRALVEESASARSRIEALLGTAVQ